MTVRVNYRLVAATLVAFVVAATSPAALSQSGATLVAATSDGTALNVTIPVFDPGIPDDPSVFREMQVFPRIRQIEAKVLQKMRDHPRAVTIKDSLPEDLRKAA